MLPKRFKEIPQPELPAGPCTQLKVRARQVSVCREKMQPLEAGLVKSRLQPLWTSI